MEIKNNNPKTILIITIIVTVVILSGLYIYRNGNPFTAKKIEKLTDVYIQQTYPQIRNNFGSADGPFHLEGKYPIPIWNEENQQYQFFDSCWVTYYYEKNTLDFYNYIYFVYDNELNLIYDSCGDRYMTGGNIYQRLSEKYNVHIMQIFDKEYNSEDSPYSLLNNGVSNYARGLFENSFSDPAFPAVENSALTQYYRGPILDINKEYTMEELASEYGKLYFNFDDDITFWPGDGTSPDDSDFQTAVDNLYKRCVEVKEIIQKHNIPFKKITITHQGNEGLININYEQLFTEDLYQFVYNNYVVGQ